MFISKNAFLTREEMQINALYISGKLQQAGWTVNAIAGVLGNIEVESTINPGIWQNLDEGNMSVGYGLVQWTPASKYIGWAVENSLQIDHMDSQLARIQYEVNNNIQWVNPQMTFKQFTKSTLPPCNLAVLFLNHYERPKNPDPQNRCNKGEYWYSFITETDPPHPVPNFEEEWVILHPNRRILRRR